MYICPDCKSQDFEKLDGFLYCSQCHVQHPDFFEAVHDFDPLASTHSVKSKKSLKRNAKDTVSVKGWTSWDYWNHILYGMVQELKNVIVVPYDFEETVFKLWACLLHRSNIAFISRLKEMPPELLPADILTERDFKELFGIELKPERKKRKLRTNRSYTSKRKLRNMLFNLSNESSLMNDSYDKLENETIESIGTSQDCSGVDSDTIISSSSKSLSKTLQKIMRDHKRTKAKKRRSNFFSKNKMLGIIHLALLLTTSRIHLSDLLRFIREGHLAFAKVTHFFPKDLQLTSEDCYFFETNSITSMPTHFHQRIILRQLAKKLDVKRFREIDIETLIHRYCADLELPDKIRDYSIRLFNHAAIEKLENLRNKFQLPNYEGLAMASILFIMKYLFGLDGLTEYLLSDLADKINRALPNSNKKVFVFHDWQKHVICRNTVLQDFHYPTEERMKEEDPFRASPGLLEILKKENKDEHRSRRFQGFQQYKMRQTGLLAAQNVLTELDEELEFNTPHFPASLTPQTCYLSIILEWWEGKMNDDNYKKQLQEYDIPLLKPFALSILKKNYKNCEVDFIFDPEKYRDALEKANFEIEEKTKSNYLKLNLIPEPEDKTVDDDSLNQTNNEWKNGDRQTLDFSKLSKSNKVIFLKNISQYWILRRSAVDKRLLDSFKINIFDKTSVNFQWLLTECSLMLEMNTREIYHELRILEKRYKYLVRG